MFEVVATDHAIYAGGHFRWLNNFNSVNASSAGAASTDRLGLAAFDPRNGLTLRNWQSDRNPRGVGVFAPISEPEGLYIGDDTDFLNGTEHKKLKFLPITADSIARPDAPSLPMTLVTANGDALDSVSYNGTTLGAASELLNSGWSDVRGGMFVGGQLFHADDNGTMWMSQLTDGVISAPVSVDQFGLNQNHWELSQLGGMFFDYEWSCVYYTIQGDSRLFYRGFSPDGAYFGDVESVAVQQGDILWSDVSGMDVIDGHLYFARNNGALFRAEIDGADVISGTTEVISGPGIDGRSWDNTLLAFLGDGMVIGGGGGGGGGDPTIEFESSGDSNGTGRFRRFDFPVTAGEDVLLRLEWLDPNAQLRIFVRDPNNNLVASDTTAAGSPKFVTIPAGNGGTHTASILVAEGSTSYTLQVNPDETPPEPLADFEFASSGSADNNSWQVFDFEVVAGELVEAQVIWADPNAQLNLFLRDETNSAVARDTDGSGSPSVASAVAATSGTWSVGVKIKTGSSVNFDVLVDTTGVEVPVTLEITNQPTDVTVNEGGDATFSVSATGNGTLSYQWFADGVAIAGATSDTLSLSSVSAEDSGMFYQVNVTDDDGTITSDSATLTVETMVEVTNIALNGVASQSSTAFGGVPSRAIDGNTNGNYGAGSVTHTANSNQPWWEVQLSELSTIETIIVYNRTNNCCTNRLTNYTVSILNSNGATVFSRDFSDAPDPSNTIDVTGVEGSTVRVQLNGTNPLSLAEVQVLGYVQ